MRVIGGRSRGRRLPAVLPAGVRPTSDRVRESIFDILWSMGGVEEHSVLDLFAGSGAMGIEAWSRGAASVTLVDRDARAVDAVRANLVAVGHDAGSHDAVAVRAELPGWLAGAAHVDLAFCDPPYDFDQWSELLGLLRADVAVLESRARVVLPEGWVVAKHRRYGSTLVTVVRQLTHQAPSPS
jgi:16S rRNA (guanine966-N2)-methyltransferase